MSINDIINQIKAGLAARGKSLANFAISEVQLAPVLAQLPAGFFDFVHHHHEVAVGFVNWLKARNLPENVHRELAKVPAAVWQAAATAAQTNPALMANIKISTLDSAPPAEHQTAIAVLKGIQYFDTAAAAVVEGAGIVLIGILLGIAALTLGAAAPVSAGLAITAVALFCVGVLVAIAAAGIDITAEIIILALGGG